MRFTGSPGRRIGLLPLAAMLAIASSCAGKPSESNAEAIVKTSIDNGNNSRLVLRELKKTDGQSAEVSGVKTYRMMFTASADFTSNATFMIDGDLPMEGRRITTGAYSAPSPGVNWGELLAASQGRRRAIKGDRLELVGELDFERRESGWVPTGLNYHVTVDSSSRDRAAEQAERAAVPSRQAGVAGGVAPSASRSSSAADADPATHAMRQSLTSMKADLRDLVTAQESYFADHVTYTSDLSRLQYRASAGVTVSIVRATGTGWSGTAARAGTTRTCGIYVGSVTAPINGQAEAEPRCN